VHVADASRRDDFAARGLKQHVVPERGRSIEQPRQHLCRGLQRAAARREDDSK